MISYASAKMLWHTSFKLNLDITVKIKHTLHCYDLIHKQRDALAHNFKLHSVITVKIKHILHCLYIELYEESVVFAVGRSAR